MAALESFDPRPCNQLPSMAAENGGRVHAVSSPMSAVSRQA
jgi:hypothetical protein